MKIDAHQHFWQYEPIRDAWINDDMSVIKRDFMPADLKPLLDKNDIDGCVAVQADQSEKETSFLLDLAQNHSWIKGVVGWVDLKKEDLNDRLAYYKTFAAFKGVRHVLQAEPDGFMLDSSFVNGVTQVGKQGLTYDILAYESQLEEALSLIQRLPVMPLVIDHISKPDIKNASFAQWAKYMRKISTHKHVHVKLSGMATEADWASWSNADIEPYLNFCLEYFGPKRLMFGSDWPVCLLSGSYDRIHQSIQSFIQKLSQDEQNQIMGLTASQFYNLK